MHPESFNCDEAYDRYEGDFTPEQWLDVSSCTKQETSSSMPTERETDDARITDSTEREALLKTYAWLYLEGITKNIEKKLLEVGATKSQNRCSEDAVLHDLGTLWASTVAKAPKEDKPQACIGIFSDIPQEETSIEYINIAFDTTLAKFKTQAANPGVVRYLIKKHHPELAETLFLDDIIVYHHPYPTAIDDSDPSFPAQIYPITRDYEATDNGWYAHVIPLEKATMVNQHRDWRPINTEADWQSLLRLIRKGSARSVFMRHKSVEDRINFVKRHREREELEIAKTGGFYTNVFLSRHMETLSPTDKFEGARQLEILRREDYY